jgi:MoaA/NifB/PqqE/SkfB family radical SAM enzyme
VPVEDYPRPTPPESELLREVDAFIASGERTLTLSGGEPTLYRDRLLTVLSRARQAGVPYAELQTNAVLLDADYAQALARAGLTSAFVSLLSHQAALHDELAGLAGAFGRCLAGIDALLDAGVLVTLNPVIAASTHALVADYVDFVAERLPRVKTISLSAVQPHGRARKAHDLMPDYAVLAREVPRARARARAHGMTLVNPYCGLPLCIGWSDGSERSIEAVEARAARQSGQRHAARGLENRGNKRHGPPCYACALRPICGGAWHAYWDQRGGSGIVAPLARVAPFGLTASQTPGQSVVASESGVDERCLAQLRAATAPTIWLVVRQLKEGDAVRLAEAGCTDLALVTEASALDAQTLRELSHLDRQRRALEPQLAVRVVAGLTQLGSFQRGYRALEQLAAAGVERTVLLLRETAALERFAAAAAGALDMPVDVGVAA